MFGMIHAIDRKGNTHDINLDRIIKEFRSQTYDGQFDETLKKLFIWSIYPLTDPEKQMGYIIANHIDEANEIIARLEMEDKIDYDAMVSLNVHRAYDLVIANNGLSKSISKPKASKRTYIFTIKSRETDETLGRGLVSARSRQGAYKVINHYMINLDGKYVSCEEFDPNKREFLMFE